MPRTYLQKQLNGVNFLRTKHYRAVNLRVVYYHSSEYSYAEEENELLSSEWYEKAFFKLKKWTHQLEHIDLIDGNLVDVNNNSRIFDDKLERKMNIFKSVARVFIGHPSMQESMRNNVMAALHANNLKSKQSFFFSRSRERQPMILDSLTKVSSFLNVSAQQRKVVRMKVCQQVTQHQIWIGALEEILNGLKSEIDILGDHCSSKPTKLAQQIVVCCLKMLESVLSYDPESTSWMRLAPKRVMDNPPLRWENVLEMFSDLVNCLSEEKELLSYLTKVEVMREGLYQIRDILVDKNIGYKENRYQESLVQKKLAKTLGHSSRCLFTLLLYYMFGSVSNLEIEVCGSVYHQGRGDNLCLCMGKILTSTEEKMVLNGMKQLDRALGLFKFVWETGGMKGNLELQGHLWCVGANHKVIPYRGNSFFLHNLGL